MVTFGGKTTPQLDLHWPGYQKHPCSSFSPNSFLHSPLSDTSPMPSHLSKMAFIVSFADPTSCASRGSYQCNNTENKTNIELHLKRMCSVSTNLTDTFCICGNLKTMFWRIPVSAWAKHHAGVDCFQALSPSVLFAKHPTHFNLL